MSSVGPRAPDSTGSPNGPHPALTRLVTDVLERAGFVLDDLDVRRAGRRRVIRIAVDSDAVPGPGDGPAESVDLDAVAALSRELSTALDAFEAGDGADAVPADEYTLEVTTPGVDRPLTLPRHWRRAWLRRVLITLADGSQVAGRVGPVTGSDEDADGSGEHADRSVTLAVDPAAGAPGTKGPARPRSVTLRALPLDDVARAVLDVEFKPAPEAEVDALRAARVGTDSTDSTDSTTTGKDQT